MEKSSFRFISTFLILAMILSMLLVTTPASAKAFIGTNYSGQIIEVTQGGTFVLRTTIKWDEVGVNGYYGVTIYWEDNNHAYDNFTVLYTRAFFDNDNDNQPDAGVEMIENSTTTIVAAGVNGTSYTFSVANWTGNENDGYVDIEICMLAASRGVPHRAWDNHTINDYGYGAIDYAEATTSTFVPAVTTIKVLAWTGGVVVRGKENCQALDMTGQPPYHLYTKGENAIIAAAQRMGSGAVFAAGTITSNAYDRWRTGPADNSPSGKYMDTLYHAAMQWMVPGADNVLWYWGHNVSSFGKFPANDNLVKVYLPALGYTVDNDNTTPIDNAWAASKLVGRDILILANLDNGTVGNGGDPSTLLDSEVAIIKEFVDNGGGLIVLDGGDYSTTGRYNMYHISNKVLNKVGFNWRFQSDSLIDDKDNYAYYTPDNIQYWGTQFRARVLPDSAIGGAYRGETGSENLNEYEPCSLIATPTWSVDVSILPSPQSQIPPATLTYTVTITNTGTGWDNYDIALTGTDNVNFARALNKTKLYLAAGASDNSVIVNENIITGAPYCTWDTITVTVTGTENTGGTQATDSANALAHATAPRGVIVSISPSYQDGLSGTTLNYTVTVTNTGGITDNYSLVAHDDLGWGLTISPNSLSVPAGENRTATLSVIIPENAVRCTEDNVIVTATSSENAEVRDNDICVAHAILGVFIGDYLKIGITEFGEFGTPLPSPGVGFQYPIGDNYESLAVGTWLDGYLVAYDSEIYTHYPEDSIVGTLIFVSERTIVNTSDLAEHEVVLKTGDNKLRLNFLFQFPKHTKFVIVKATFTNISGGTLNDVYYKRVMDWDVWAPSLGYNNWWGWDEGHDLGVAFLTPAETGDRYVYMGTAGYPSPTGYDINAWDDTDNRGFGDNHDTTPITSPIKEDDCLGLHWSLGDLPPNESVTAYAIYVAADTLSELRGNVDSALNIITPPPPPPPAAPKVGVNVSISPSSRSGTPGTTLTYTVTVRNTGEAADNFDLRISGKAGWSPGISPSSLTLAAGASGTATLRVTVPSGAAEGDSTTIAVTATSRADPSVSGSASCRAIALAPPPGPPVSPPPTETPGLAIAVMVAAVAAIVLSLGFILLKL